MGLYPCRGGLEVDPVAPPGTEPRGPVEPLPQEPECVFRSWSAPWRKPVVKTRGAIRIDTIPICEDLEVPGGRKPWCSGDFCGLHVACRGGQTRRDRSASPK
jgi:hypothetical protein